MYKTILTAVAILSCSSTAFAEKAELFNCVDIKTLQAEPNCVESTIAGNNDSDEFFLQLTHKEFPPKADAFATVTYFPNKNLIEVKSLEKAEQELLLVNR